MSDLDPPPRPSRPEDWATAFGTLEDHVDSERARGPRFLFLLAALALGALAGFCFHFMGRYFWIPILPALVFGAVGAVGSLLVCDTHRSSGLGGVMLVAALLGGFAYASVHFWNTIEFYFWGGAQRLYNLEMAKDVDIIHDQPPIAGPRELLRERVGRSDLLGYYVYEGRAGRVLMYSRRYPRRHSMPQLRRLSGEVYWLEAAAELLGAAIVASAAARKLAAW